MLRVLILLCAVMTAAAAPISPGLRAVDGQGMAVEPSALFDALASADVVMLGEEHNDPGAHRFELAVLEALALRSRKVVLAMEMFERDQQAALSDYVLGRITEPQMLERIKPWSNYRADYRPLVEFAKVEGWPVVASNVPRPVAAQVSRQGLAALDALEPARRSLAAADVQCPEDAYYAKFAAAMGGGHSGAPITMSNMFLAQCLKDETMAESVAMALAPGVTVVHVNGAFHSEGGMGVPTRIARRAPGTKIVTVVVAPKGQDIAARAGDGDFVVTYADQIGAD